jgi:hypothetical protein
MSGYVYLSDLAEMGQDIASQIRTLEQNAAGLDAQAAAYEQQAAGVRGSNSLLAAQLASQAAALRQNAAAARNQANVLRSQQSTSGGVTGSDVLNFTSQSVVPAGTQIASALITAQAQRDAARIASRGGNTTPGFDAPQQQSQGGGLGLIGGLVVGTVVIGAIATVAIVASRQSQPPVRANKKRRRNNGCPCGDPACSGCS